MVNLLQKIEKKRGEKFIKNFNLNNETLQNLYDEMVADIKELKKQYGNKIVCLDSGLWVRWELELFKKWKAIKIKNRKEIVIADVLVESKGGRKSWEAFNYTILTDLLDIYKNRLNYAKEQEERAFLGDEEFEKRKNERMEKLVGKLRSGVKRILNKNSFEDLPEEDDLEEDKISEELSQIK